MDKFTRNYSIVLGLVIVVLVAVFMYEDPQIQSLNDRLLQDTRLSSLSVCLPRITAGERRCNHDDTALG